MGDLYVLIMEQFLPILNDRASCWIICIAWFNVYVIGTGKYTKISSIVTHWPDNNGLLWWAVYD